VTRFRYSLYSAEGGSFGEFTTLVPNWGVGETFTTGDGRHFRILKMVAVEDAYGAANGIWEVEPIRTHAT
jgi:hypothetical protein